MSIVLPFIIAAASALLLNGIIGKLSTKTGIKRSAVSFVIVLVFTAAVLGLVTLLVYSIYAWLSDTLKLLPQYLPVISELTDNVTSFFSEITDGMPQSVTDALNKMPGNIISSATGWITDILSGFASSVPDASIFIMVTIIASFIVTRDYYKLSGFLREILKRDHYRLITRSRDILVQKTCGIFKGYLILTLITFAQLLVGLLLLKIKYAPAIAAVIAFVDLMPVLGTGTVLIPWAVYCVITGDFYTGIGLTVLYAVTSIVQNAVSPKIIGTQMKLSSLIVLFSMYVGYRIFGLGGLLLSPFIVAVIRDIIMDDEKIYSEFV